MIKNPFNIVSVLDSYRGVPCSNDLVKLKPLDSVQLYFDDTERLWVEIISYDEETFTFTGIVISQPLILSSVDKGTYVAFRHGDVFGITFHKELMEGF